jgi:hypothetical protein
VQTHSLARRACISGSRSESGAVLLVNPTVVNIYQQISFMLVSCKLVMTSIGLYPKTRSHCRSQWHTIKQGPSQVDMTYEIQKACAKVQRTYFSGTVLQV